MQYEAREAKYYKGVRKIRLKERFKMNNITEKAIKVITYLQKQSLHNTVEGPIYIPKEYIATLEDLLISHQKQAVLIKTVKDHIEKAVIEFDDYYNELRDTDELANFIKKNKNA